MGSLGEDIQLLEATSPPPLRKHCIRDRETVG